jgi:hypothetical protein
MQWLLCLMLSLQSTAFLIKNVNIDAKMRKSCQDSTTSDGFSRMKITIEMAKSSDDNNRNDNPVDSSSELLNQRLHKMRAKVYEQQMALPPNPNLSPTEFITAILTHLHRPDHFMPQSGFRTLLRSSSPKWKAALRRSIGVPSDLEDAITEDALISSLASAMTRPKNQYQILVHDDDNEEDDVSSYAIYFPGDIVDYLDGNCWLETQLREKESGKLLVIMGWSLVQNEKKEWLIDRLDWQDFRDEFRPGIGREEWMRICG